MATEDYAYGSVGLMHCCMLSSPVLHESLCKLWAAVSNGCNQNLRDFSHTVLVASTTINRNSQTCLLLDVPVKNRIAQLSQGVCMLYIACWVLTKLNCPCTMKCIPPEYACLYLV